MISSLFLINQKGEVIIYRTYRSDVPRDAITTFRKEVIARKEAGGRAPILLVDGVSYLYTRHANLYLVAATKSNASAALTFQFLYQVIKIFNSYFGEKWDESTVRSSVETCSWQ